MSDKVKVWDVAAIITVQATSYDEAVSMVQDAAEHMLDGDEALQADVVTNYEHDNEGQRVLYLHAEDDPLLVEPTL